MSQKRLRNATLGLILSSFACFSLAETDMSVKTVEGAKTINVTEAKALFDQEALFVDPRKDSDWDTGRIPGAVHLDINSALSEAALLEEISKDEAVVFYCNGIKCKRSGNAAKKAVSWGFTNVYYFRSGLPAWKAAGYPVE